MSAAMRSRGVASTSERGYAPSVRHRARPQLHRPHLPGHDSDRSAYNRPSVCTKAVGVQSSVQAAADAKQALLELILDTRRGSNTSKGLRGQIEEAQVNVEACSGPELQYELLEGKWKLLYTTAADVLPILSLDTPLLGLLPAPVQVGNIYQRFSSPDIGKVQNIIQFSLPLLRESDGVTFTVGASYEVRSPHRIALTFEEAQVGSVAISPTLEALLAPALLPRGFWTLQLLLAIKEFKLVFPFQSAQQIAQGRGVGANYLLTYLDEDMLIGRASGTAGTFIFSREVEQQD